MKKVYVMGSLRQDVAPTTADAIRSLGGFDVFDDWHAVGPEADDHWQAYEKARGRTYGEALKGRAARNTFGFDWAHLSSSDIGVLTLPAGKSAHLELGYLVGLGKRTYILFAEGEPDRWDVMYQFADAVFFDIDDLLEELKHVSCTEI